MSVCLCERKNAYVTHGAALAQAGSRGGCVLEVDPQVLGAQALTVDRATWFPHHVLPPPLPPDKEPEREPWVGWGSVQDPSSPRSA